MESGDVVEPKGKPKIGRPKGSKTIPRRLFKKPQLQIKKADREKFEKENPDLSIAKRRGPGRVANLPAIISSSLPTSALRRRAYREYCEWIAQGKSPRTFVFRDGGTLVSGTTMEKYRTRFPEDMPEELYEAAVADCLEFWDSVGEEMMLGQVPYHDGKIWAHIWEKKWKEEQKQTVSAAQTGLQRLTSLLQAALDLHPELKDVLSVESCGVIEVEPEEVEGS